MQNLRIKIIAVAGLGILLSTASCKKWINNTPEPLQVDESIIFSTEKGFQEALTGVYLQMGAESLYGRDLTVGVLSLLGRSYDLNLNESIGGLFYQSARYNLQDPSLRVYSTKVWSNMYQSIANLNNLLINLERKKNLFTGNNYQRIKGEALALRAYLHFDLLRLFAAAPAAGTLSAPGIPYVTTINATNTIAGTVGAGLDQCEEDLTNAESLLDTKDITNYRINNLIVKGVLARLYLYKGDYKKASDYSNAIINSNKLALAKNSTDVFFPAENMFSLYISQAPVFHKAVLGGQAKLGFSAANQTALYATGSGVIADWRKSFVDPLTGLGTGSPFMPRKFAVLGSKTSFPMIRLTEMYYIAAECAVNARDAVTATALLDTVRIHRNLPKYTLTALSTDSLNVEIRREYQKEFIAEGQLFFYFKRKNIPFSSLPFTSIPVDANATYVFVKPE
ncbi:RagB/SusD family nutrient uptake outer membrane protein [Pedobacter sp. PLR]|uniref:RagB/SusD family nutrient uptake outer membrane protein n=1 Tax=Pedobacter sp. PLR TaxID=2994465 RepID=UPI0022476EC4|nr:RagB/SusD family nutrient uptake outer membrane protein [Pedobacter sp. PLR]MCX2452451.1 RagB/SusD family nutrient uptake outer membrane protein [Pedobacter sp. PLR]